jgi:hypothetical protein
VDVFGNIGGFSDIVAFTMLVLYAWYSGLKLRLTLINKSILHFNIDYGRESDLYKNSTLANVTFSMGDLVKYFLMNMCCCGFRLKQDSKYQVYIMCCKFIEEKLDIVTI